MAASILLFRLEGMRGWPLPFLVEKKHKLVLEMCGGNEKERGLAAFILIFFLRG